MLAAVRDLHWEVVSAVLEDLVRTFHGVRSFQASDWLGAIIACPHCGQLLKVIQADGPYVGRDPSEGYRVDNWWRLTLEDGADTRMWEDRKGIVVEGEFQSAARTN